MPIQSRFFRPGSLPVLSIVLLAGAAAAQAPEQPPQAASPVVLEYTSTLSGYKPYADQAVQSWREANDEVGRIGGWRAYAREMQAGEAPKDGSSAPAGQPGQPMDAKP